MNDHPRSVIGAALRQSSGAFASVGIFSFFINLLMLTAPIYMLQVYDRVLASRSEATLVVLTVFAVGLLLVYGMLEAVRTRVLVRIGVRLDETMGRRTFAGVFAHTLWTGKTGSSQSLRDIATIREFISGQGLLVFFDAPWVPLYLLVIYLFHPLLGLLATAGAVILFSMAILTDMTTRRLLDGATREGIGASRFVDLGLRNAEAVGAMGMLSRIMQRWHDQHAAAVTLHAMASDRAGAISASSRFWRLSLQVGILGAGAFLVLQDQITPGVMIAASIVMGRALAPIEAAVGTWKTFLAARSADRRLQDLLGSLPETKTRMPLPPPTGRIEVDRAVVLPPGAKQPSLKEISFSLAAGETLGVIGPSGAGKSSLARLLIGVWPARAGTVRFDGSEIDFFDPEMIGDHIGYLPQDVELFEGTIAENIARFGHVDAEAVIEAAGRAGVHDMIARLPDGYDSFIGAGGQMLAGGQRQRIGLARALYGRPSIVVLDEPNSNLDAAGEAALTDAIASMKTAGQTVVVITHRPSILFQLDLILVLQDGRVAEMGRREAVFDRLRRAASNAAAGHISTLRPATAQGGE